MLLVHVSGEDQRCSASVEPGYCRLPQPKYVYDKRRNSCAQMTLGNCAGDEDKFDTMEQCTNACINKN